MEYLPYPDNKPKKGQLCICECFEWCAEGFQIARFDGIIFDYDECSNEMFNGLVTGFICLDEDGIPVQLD